MQTICLTEVTIDYSRPNVVSNEKTAPERSGANRYRETTPNPMTGRTLPALE
ncbi:MAG: hypothetical protein R2824_18475 [Saprospiraceae bacterium]